MGRGRLDEAAAITNCPAEQVAAVVGCFEHPENSHPRSCRPPADIQDTIAFPRQAVSMVRSARWLPPKLIASRVRSQFGSKGSGAAAAGGKQRAAKLQTATKQ